MTSRSVKSLSFLGDDGSDFYVESCPTAMPGIMVCLDGSDIGVELSEEETRALAEFLITALSDSSDA